MKKTAIYLLAACLLWSTWGYTQSISLSLKNVPLKIVFDEIEKQTRYEYTFFYAEAWLEQAKPVTLELKNVSLLEVLKLCFADQSFTYVITGTIITIVAKDNNGSFKLQRLSIKGLVTNTDSLPLQANIEVMGTKEGTTTDVNGFFKLLVIGKNVNLLVSHVGYESQVIKAQPGEQLLRICLTPELKPLDEVIKNGYINTPRRYSLSSVSRITAEDIAKQPVNNLFAGMEGRTPGIFITQKSGLPGSEFAVQIRGQKSIGTSPGLLPPNSPLFIIDGVPFLSSSETLIQRTDLPAFNPFNTINVEDIESIEILRGANAVSIYGSMGANGIVLITTKRPRPNKTMIDVNMYAGIGKITRSMDYMNLPQYLQMRRKALINDQEVATIANSPDLLVWDTTRSTDWKKLLIGGTARITNSNIRVSGGSANTQFTGSVGHNKETTVFPGSSGKSLSSLSFQLIHNSKDKKLDLALVSSYGYDKTNLPFRDLTNVIAQAPNAPPPYDSLGNLTFREKGISFGNPFSFIYQPVTMLMERFTANFKLNYKIFPWLQAKSNIGETIISGDEKTIFPIYSQDPISNPTGAATYGNTKNKTWIIEPQLEFTKELGFKNKLKALVGTSFREQLANSQLILASGYPSDAIPWSPGNAPSKTISVDRAQYRIHSIYGLFNYTYDNKYIFEATARRDGSSRFGPARQFASFGSLAVGWILSNENFFKKNIPFISYGKLRASYGTTGNDQIGDYRFLDVWVSTPYPYQVPGFRPSRLFNNDYSWELQKSFDIGFDLGLFDDRILLTAIWNQNRTSNQLIGITLPTQTGFPEVLKNFPAIVENTDIEIHLTSNNISNKRFKWKSSFNITIPRNKLLKFPGIESSAYYKTYRIGQPLGLIWGYNTGGVDPTTGIYRILDKNGKPIDIPNSFPSNNDLDYFGSYNPYYYGGLENSFQYGAWKLDFLLQFIKQNGSNPIAAQSPFAGFSGFNQPTALLKEWEKPGQSATYQQYTQSEISVAYIAAYYYSTSNISLADASFIRLKNISISYNLPQQWIEKLKINTCNIYAQGQNLLVFTPYKGSDPENSAVNAFGLPPLKIFAVGLRASF